MRDHRFYDDDGHAVDWTAINSQDFVWTDLDDDMLYLEANQDEDDWYDYEPDEDELLAIESGDAEW